MHVLTLILQSLLLSLGMFWQVMWSLILGFLLSAIIQTVVPRNKIEQTLGKENAKTIALATLFGAISSSCSYAAASMSKSLFKKGAGLIPSLAFLFASTNLVLELGIILLLLMGWQFTFAEWLGGIVLIIIMSILIKLTYPKKLIERARNISEEQNNNHQHHKHTQQHTTHNRHPELVSGSSVGTDARQASMTIIYNMYTKKQEIAQTFFMEFSMLKKDLFLGFLLAGIIGVIIPQTVWHLLFLSNSSNSMQFLSALIIGPIIAVVSFVCSIGNVPLAAILWSSGMPFGGVISFLYADLIVLPLIDVYRKYYGWKMAFYITAIFFITMIFSAGIMEILFSAFNQIPTRPTNMIQSLTMFQINYTFWLNIIFGALGVYLFFLQRKTAHRMHH